MKIQPVNINNSYTFQAKKKDIRKADDIVRRVNQEFPAFSPTRVKYFWHPINEKKLQLLEKPLLNIMRIRERIGREINEDKFLLGIFDEIETNKTANCGEKSWLTLGALAANGYDKSVKSAIGLKWEAYDMRNNETLIKGKIDLDHSAILTTMSKKKVKKPQDLIVLDPWFNKAMSYSEASAEYFKLLNDNRMLKIHKEIINKLKEKNPNGEIDLSNYNIRFNIVFIDSSCKYKLQSKDDMEKFGKVIAEKYPELILKEQK